MVPAKFRYGILIAGVLLCVLAFAGEFIEHRNAAAGDKRFWYAVLLDAKHASHVLQMKGPFHSKPDCRQHLMAADTDPDETWTCRALTADQAKAYRK